MRTTGVSSAADAVPNRQPAAKKVSITAVVHKMRQSRHWVRRIAAHTFMTQ